MLNPGAFFFGSLFFCMVFGMPINKAGSQTLLKAVAGEQYANLEPLRQKIFGDRLGQRDCQPVTTHPKSGATKIDEQLDSFLKKLMETIQARDEKAMLPLFHPRLNIGIPAVSQTLARIGSVYGLPIDVSMLQLYALNTVDGTPGPIPCAKDSLTIYPQYGYPLQFGVFLQILGKVELGRLFVSAVYTNDRWYIGALHSQQWTHAEKSGMDWAAAAKDDLAAKRPLAAWAKYDLAVKLFDGGKFVSYAAKMPLETARDQIMSKAEWQKAIQAALPGKAIEHTAMLLVVDGVGILLRQRVAAEISLETMKKECRQAAKTLAKSPVSKGFTGIRCSFIMPKEDPTKEGGLGGLYLAFNEVEKPSKKSSSTE